MTLFSKPLKELLDIVNKNGEKIFKKSQIMFLLSHNNQPVSKIILYGKITFIVLVWTYRLDKSK